MTQLPLVSPWPFIFAQISSPKAAPSRFASYTQSGETKASRRKALNSTTAHTRAGAPG